MAIASSTAGYRHEIGARHDAHRPRNARNETIGTFCHHRIRDPHCGQELGGDTIDSPRGTRQMTTFAKDPRR
jgi:hypothetical protein